MGFFNLLLFINSITERSEHHSVNWMVGNLLGLEAIRGKSDFCRNQGLMTCIRADARKKKQSINIIA